MISTKERKVCKKKRRHPDEMTARIAAMAAINQRKDSDRLFVYHCLVCHGWHLTRFPIKGVAAVDKENLVCNTVVAKEKLRTSFLRLRTLGQRRVGNVILEAA